MSSSHHTQVPYIPWLLQQQWCDGVILIKEFQQALCQVPQFAYQGSR